MTAAGTTQLTDPNTANDTSISLLVRDGKYRAALAESQRLLGARKDLSKDEITRLLFREADCYYRVGEYRTALQKLQACMRFAAAQCDNKLRGEQKALLARIYLQLGEVVAAIEAFNESYVFFKSVGESREVVFSLFGLASAHFIRGHYDRSAEVLRSAAAICSKTGQEENLRRCEYNLCRVHIFAGEFVEARVQLADLEDRVTDQYGVARLTSLKGMVNVYMLESTEADQRLRQALNHYQSVGSRRDEVVCLEYLGLNNFFAGDYEAARRCYLRIMERAEITASAKARTYRLLTDVYLAQGKRDEAVKMAKDAERAINNVNEQIELGAIKRTLGLLAASSGDSAKAQDYLEQSLRLLRKIGARYERALTLLGCGSSGVYSREERINHLSLAADLFMEMTVPKRVAEVERVAASLSRNSSALSLPRRSVARIASRNSESEVPIVIARCDKMRQVLSAVETAKESDLTILLTGETGTGKDLLAKYIHSRSGCSGDFISVNSAAIPNDMVESELFGYAEGAFTGARKKKPGLLEMAHKGTFYLNEVADCSLRIQAKLLEALELRQIRRLGENRKRRIDFRLVVGTNQDLQGLISAGRFRQDLYYRLNEYQIDLPPLRERPEDIPLLVQHFLGEIGLSLDAAGEAENCDQLSRLLAERSWPGNVRMLRGEVRRLWFASHRDLKRMVEMAAKGRPRSERQELLELLAATDWNQSEAARRLGVSEAAVRKRIRKHNLR